jgi:hypothetical protein
MISSENLKSSLALLAIDRFVFRIITAHILEQVSHNHSTRPNVNRFKVVLFKYDYFGRSIEPCGYMC